MTDKVVSVVPVDPNQEIIFKLITCKECDFVFTVKTEKGYDMRPAYACHTCKTECLCMPCLVKNHQHE